MARSRNFKPEHLLDERLAACSMPARVLFFGLGTVADRAGRLDDRPLRIKAAVLPYDSVDVEPLLAELAANGMITRYIVGEGRYIQISDWEKHQTPHYKEPESAIPQAPQPRHERAASGQEPGQQLDSMRQEPGHAEACLGKSSTSTNPAALIPDSGFLIADTGSLILSADQPPARSARRKAKQPAATGEGKTTATWNAYAAAYERRYKTKPVRSAKASGQLAKFVDVIGSQEAPQVAAFYVRSSERFYEQAYHSVDLLLRDAPKLRTQWATGTRPRNGSTHHGYKHMDYEADESVLTGEITA